MTSAAALKLVLIRELKERGKSGAYLASTLVTTLLILAGILIPAFLSGPEEYDIGSIGQGNEELITLATDIANTNADEDQLTSFTVTSFDSVASAETALDSGDVDLVLIDGNEIVLKSAAGAGGDEVSDLIQEAASTRAIESLVGETDADVVAILAGEPLELRALEGVESEENGPRTVIAYGGLVLMYIAVLSYGAWTLTGVTEEKSNRVVEVLLATVKPWQLLAGKVLGIGLLGLAQFVFTIAAALVAIRITGVFELPALPIDSMLMLVLWFLLGFSVYSILFGAAGSLVSRMEDAQTASTPLTMVALIGFFASFQVLNDPDGLLAVILTFVPLTAPFVVPVRFALESIDPIQLVASVVVTVISIAGLVRFAGRVYAGGLLQFGQRLKWREAFQSADL